jgi:hypothetical protein
MKISREESIEIAMYGSPTKPKEIAGKPTLRILEESQGKRRWFEEIRVVISHDGKFYTATYDEPLTEMQEGGRFEGEDPVEWKEVFAKEKTITVYE